MPDNKIIQRPSPNFSENAILPKSLIVIHKTLGRFNGALSWMRNPASQVSAQFLISRKGTIVQMVGIKKVAWHSGRISRPSELARKVLKKHPWGTRINPNRYSIGIEFEWVQGDGDYTEAQIAAGAVVIKMLGIKTILAHHEITAGKPNMDGWREELLKRAFGAPVMTPPNSSQEVVRLLNRSVNLTDEAIKLLLKK